MELRRTLTLMGQLMWLRRSSAFTQWLPSSGNARNGLRCDDHGPCLAHTDPTHNNDEKRDGRFTTSATVKPSSSSQLLSSPQLSSSHDGHPTSLMTSRSGFLSTMLLAATTAPSVADAVSSLDSAQSVIPSSSSRRLSGSNPASTEFSNMMQGSMHTSIANTAATTSATQMSSKIQESISGFAAGASLVATKTVVKYPLDTATVRVQMPNSDYTIRNPFRLFAGSYDGITLSLLSNIPGGAIFFATKDFTKAALKESPLTQDMPRWLLTTAAVATAQLPYWCIRNPSEVIKVRQQTAVDGYGNGTSALEAFQTTLRSSGNSTLQEFYTGYWENIAYALPADVVKFVAYDTITQGRKNLPPLEGATAGAMATAVAQLATTPLDVVRNRLMTGTSSPETEGYFESLATIAKEEGWRGLFAGATPRVGKAILSGAIQFATYEETKRKMSRMLEGPNVVKKEGG